MKIVEYNSNKLIEFYSNNDIEISEEHNYLGCNLKSFVIIENDEILGAVTISNYSGKNFLEVIAIKRDSRGKGVGKILLDKVIKQLNDDVYTISKTHDFYLKYGFEFIEDNENMISDNCKICKEYNKTCFPKVMIFKK